MLRDLQGQAAVVTGGGSGIGRGLCRAFAEEGMHVIAGDIELEAAAETAELIRDEGGSADAVWIDVTRPESLDALAADVYGRLGAVGVLCNNAGVMMRGSSVDAPPDDWRWLLSVNVEGVANGVRVFAPRMRLQGAPAHIVNTASIAGLDPLDSPTMFAPYAASKAAVVAMSEVMWRELAPWGIGVSILLPGRTPTNIGSAHRNRPVELRGRSSPAADAADAQRTAEQAIADLKSMEPIAVARKVVAGVRANRLYILADPTRRVAPEAHWARMTADFDASAAEDAALEGSRRGDADAAEVEQ